jgi:3-isopropylmalate dehydrogenase
MKTYKIPVIAGDGIGPEIIREGKKVLEAVSERLGFLIEWLDMPYGTDHYLKTGELFPDNELEELANHKAIFMGSFGDPRVEPGVIEMGIILKIRFHFDQYVNLRPIMLFEGINCPIKDKSPGDVRIFVIRENTEDFYLGLGGRVKKGTYSEKLDFVRSAYKAHFDITIETDSKELAYNLGVISREGAERVIRYGFELAKDSGMNKVTTIDKANVLPHMYGLWRETAKDIATAYPHIELEMIYADAATMWFIKNPERFQVVVAPNLFGDILTDLGAGIVGGLGLIPGGNINPDGVSMFEPMHGSAPKYKGQNVANPIATIWSGALMLDFLGEKDGAELILEAIRDVLKYGQVKTPDLGGTSSTQQMGDAIARRVLDGC